MVRQDQGAVPMTYVIVTGRNTIAEQVFMTFEDAVDAATERYGDNVETWLTENVRVEENR